VSRRIVIEEMTKVEGHATLALRVSNGRVAHCELRAVEGSRYFEGLLLRRRYHDASEIASRICGICSCAHTVAAIQAIENALGLAVSEQTMALRVLLTLGERIRSHATHLLFFALPDYVGSPSALTMALERRSELEQGLRLMKAGNETIKVIGGRDLHPVSATVGGFLKVPEAAELDALRLRLERAKPAALATAELFNGLAYPELHHQAEHFSLHSDEEYATLSGRIRSADHEFEQEEYDRFLTEYHTPDQTANFVVRGGRTYMVGALSRIANNIDRLSPDARQLVESGPLLEGLDNPFYNNIAQAVEIVHCIDEALRILDKLQPRPEPVPDVPLREGRGVAAIEVPRGTLWHEYVLDSAGYITHSNIITPTAQNLRCMEEDFRILLPTVAHLERETIVAAAEQLIRAYDPCFSCAAHFLRVRWLPA
jgi:sulfhydrogenase subunit alpha